MTDLWHFTCDHGHRALGDEGRVLPPRVQDPSCVARFPAEYRWLSTVSWFTDLPVPDVDALGLTKTTIACDRTEFRYRALDVDRIVPFSEAGAPAELTAHLLDAPGADPTHWFVARRNVRVQLDRVPARVVLADILGGAR